MSSALPHRPRLTDQVIARRHVGEDDVVVLHDHATRRVTRILPVQWQVLALADGTRDVEGVALAAGARGIETDPADLEGFLTHLAALGMLTDGPSAPADEGDEDPDADLLDVPLDPIDGWTFRCTGRGACCEVFPTILFTPMEAHRALAVLPDEPHDFYPERGGGREGGALAPVLVEGRCRYLDDARRCALHARAGFDAKPGGCRAFPMQPVYDGERVRVSFAFECACVVDGVGDATADPPVPPEARVLGDLPRPTQVGRVPERVALDATRALTRAEARALLRGLADAPAPPDVARGLFALSSGLASGLASGPLDAALLAYGAPGADAAAALGLVATFRAHVAAWREPLAAFRAPTDLTRLAFDWLLGAADRIAARGLPPAPPPGSREAAIEAFYVRACAWSMRDALGPLPLTTALGVRAVRVWLARAIAAEAPSDPRAAEPLPLVEVVFRAAGLDAFATA